VVISRPVIAGSVAVLISLVVFVCVICQISVYRITSGSMEPDFPVGSLVVDSAAAGIEPGRALTFTADGAVVTHVLVGFNDDGSLITRGTANDDADRWLAPVRPDDVRGRVLFNIPFTAPSFWTAQRIFVALFILLAALPAVLYARFKRSSK
jgi:signal peptidase